MVSEEQSQNNVKSVLRLEIINLQGSIQLMYLIRKVQFSKAGSCRSAISNLVKFRPVWFITISPINGISKKDDLMIFLKIFIKKHLIQIVWIVLAISCKLLNVHLIYLGEVTSARNWHVCIEFSIISLKINLMEQTFSHCHHLRRLKIIPSFWGARQNYCSMLMVPKSGSNKSKKLRRKRHWDL